MKLSEIDEHILRDLWIIENEVSKNGSSIEPFLKEEYENVLTELENLNLITKAINSIDLTSKGSIYAKSIVRRHRLAERLFFDVFEMESILIDEKACRFEHIIQEDLEVSICTLLGHPKFCPHGEPIPEGKCCKQSKWLIESTVRPLLSMKKGQAGKVAYIHSLNEKKIQKLISMGVLPGLEIKLKQKQPSIVFNIGYSEFAVDEEMAKDIYIKVLQQ
ncbi:MAG: metal-dependent transcriptional regulator [Bacteroidetes bacterium]|nr:metal-dependent transcriptional regulator [Bacteroidota bacterium]